MLVVEIILQFPPELGTLANRLIILGDSGSTAKRLSQLLWAWGEIKDAEKANISLENILQYPEIKRILRDLEIPPEEFEALQETAMVLIAKPR